VVVVAAEQDDNVPTIAPPPMAPRTPAPPHDAPEPGAAAVSTAPAGTQEHVPTAAEKHAGMLDPWSEGEGPTGVSATAAAPAPPPHFPPPAARVASVHHEPPAPPPLPPPPRAPSVHHEPPPAPPRTPSVHHEPTATPQPRAPSTHQEPAAPPPRARAPSAHHEPTATPAPPPRTPSVHHESPAPPPRTPSVHQEPVPTPPTATAADDDVVTSAPPPARAAVSLAQVEALSDLPDDARDAFAAAAKVQDLGIDDEVSGFALALVLEGSLDLAATIVDTPADRLEVGAILRSRGTIDHASPIRLIGATDGARVATWDDDAVTRAFHACPWVEDELRAAGDRYQALVGVTMGPLGDRLDPSLRAEVTSRLKVRALEEHEVCAAQGTPVPGLLVVGAGELELLGDDGQPNGSVLSPGDFLFAAEALRAAPAPNTARAAKGGALVLFADRNLAQELLVTCPPLLEIFAGM
jgi:hypothetical protein